VFNGATFFEFLRQLVSRHDGSKVLLIIDNAPCHQLDEDDQHWLRENRHRIELHRLPAYSTFNIFQRRPEVITADIARFR